MIRTYQRNVVKKLSQTDNNIYYYDGSKLLGNDFEEKRLMEFILMITAFIV